MKNNEKILFYKSFDLENNADITSIRITFKKYI